METAHRLPRFFVWRLAALSAAQGLLFLVSTNASHSLPFILGTGFLGALVYSLVEGSLIQRSGLPVPVRRWMAGFLAGCSLGIPAAIGIAIFFTEPMLETTATVWGASAVPDGVWLSVNAVVTAVVLGFFQARSQALSFPGVGTSWLIVNALAFGGTAAGFILVGALIVWAGRAANTPLLGAYLVISSVPGVARGLALKRIVEAVPATPEAPAPVDIEA